MNDAMNDDVFIKWIIYHKVYDKEIEELYKKWLVLCKEYKRLEYTYFINEQK